MTRYGTSCLIALIGICFALPGAAAATAPGVNGEIAFTSTRDGNRELYLMNPDGSQQFRLTSNPAEDDWADEFLAVWQHLSGTRDYHPYWDLTNVVSFDPDQVEPRLDEFVAAAAARL